jgi:hypothetical protein
MQEFRRLRYVALPRIRPVLIDALKIYLDILLLRRGPEDVPSSPSLLLATLALFITANVVLRSLVPPAQDVWPIGLAVSIAFGLLWYRMLLTVFGRPERYLQLVTAVFGVATLLSPLLVPLGSVLEARAQAEADPPAWTILLLPLLIFSVYVNARILGAAIERPLALAIALIVLQTLIELLLMFLVVGPRDAGAPAG